MWNVALESSNHVCGSSTLYKISPVDEPSNESTSPNDLATKLISDLCCSDPKEPAFWFSFLPLFFCAIDHTWSLSTHEYPLFIHERVCCGRMWDNTFHTQRPPFISTPRNFTMGWVRDIYPRIASVKTTLISMITTERGSCQPIIWPWTCVIFGALKRDCLD